jgi:hypothetical protein
MGARAPLFGTPAAFEDTPLTVKEIEARNTRIVKMNGGWYAYLVIDHQSFCICERTTKRRARWFCKMISAALERLIATHKEA